MREAKRVWVICADPKCSSCVVSAVYESRKEAKKWIEQENKRLGFSSYWVEQSQLIEIER